MIKTKEDVEFHSYVAGGRYVTSVRLPPGAFCHRHHQFYVLSKDQNGQITGIVSNQGKLVSKQIFNINLIKMSTRGHLALRLAECCIPSL